MSTRPLTNHFCISITTKAGGIIASIAVAMTRFHCCAESPRALAELTQPIIFPDMARRDTKFVAKKLGLSREELETMIDAPAISHYDYPNSMTLHKRLSSLKGLIRRSFGATTS